MADIESFAKGLKLSSIKKRMGRKLSGRLEKVLVFRWPDLEEVWLLKNLIISVG